MEHKKYVVAVAIDTSYAKTVNKSPVSVFDIKGGKGKTLFSILPNNQLIVNRNGEIYNIWSSYSTEQKALARRMRLSKVAMFDTDYEFEVRNRGVVIKGGAGSFPSKRSRKYDEMEVDTE